MQPTNSSSLMCSRIKLTACKLLMLQASIISAHICVGSDGFIARYSTFVAASQDAYAMLWRNYRIRSMRHMSGRYEISINRIGNLPTVFSNVSQSLPAHSVWRSSPGFSDLTSRQVRFRHFTRVGSLKIPSTRCFLQPSVCSPLSMSMVRQRYNFPIFQSRSS